MKNMTSLQLTNDTQHRGLSCDTTTGII